MNLLGRRNHPHRLGASNNTHAFLPVLQAARLRPRRGETSLFGLETPCSPHILTWWTLCAYLCPSYKDTSEIGLSPTRVTSICLIPSLKTRSPNRVPFGGPPGMRVPTYGFGGGHSSAHPSYQWRKHLINFQLQFCNRERTPLTILMPVPCHESTRHKKGIKVVF